MGERTAGHGRDHLALDDEIEPLAQQSPAADPGGWGRRSCGIDSLSPMIFVAEILDSQHVQRPRRLMASVGADRASLRRGRAPRDRQPDR